MIIASERESTEIEALSERDIGRSCNVDRHLRCKQDRILVSKLKIITVVALMMISDARD